MCDVQMLTIAHGKPIQEILWLLELPIRDLVTVHQYFILIMMLLLIPCQSLEDVEPVPSIGNH